MADNKVYVSYDQVHSLLATTSQTVLDSFKPDFIIAIGGGGFIPSRILRTFLRVPILAVGLELYDDKTDKAHSEVRKRQWLDSSSLDRLAGKNVLIVDEVDDTRRTLLYCVDELKKHNVAGVGCFVIHNKKKEKFAELSEDVKYFSGEDIEDLWIVYPWEALDIDEHTKKSTK
eukprot:TRINITY_DN624_c0_g1_i3.p1 TRINITY_DN624_c0_g1~~TRINITY_DN624_c0_g1_i3.p1  ORF type:complete len:173 (+),score=46.58 TRINITY_DN624_c0_g1_i3:299-817(+)